MARVESEYRLGTPNPVMLFEFAVSSWCNYRCTYCIVPVDQHRHESHHAFDYHPVESWIDAFQRLPHDFSLLCRGGEPFLDHEGFARFLGAVGLLPQLKYMRVDTNGSWAPELYDSVPLEVRRNTQLNISFHPTQITLDRFKARFARIVEAGWQVGMINYVMESNQAGQYDAVHEYFQRQYGIYVNPNPDIFDPAWSSQDPAARVAVRRKFSALLPAVDVLRKTGAPTQGRPCFFPSIAYFIAADGTARRACGAKVAGDVASLDFIRDSVEVRPLASPVSCPQRACLCLDRYAFLEEIEERGRSLNLLDEYVSDCIAHRPETSASVGRRAGRVWEAFSSIFSPRKRKEAAPEVPSEPNRRRLVVLQKEPERAVTERHRER
jgi:hypothetical protein